jgi:hypothetical protein
MHLHHRRTFFRIDQEEIFFKAKARHVAVPKEQLNDCRLDLKSPRHVLSKYESPLAKPMNFMPREIIIFGIPADFNFPDITLLEDPRPNAVYQGSRCN